MSETLTKQISEEVFDLDKVGVGDIVEFFGLIEVSPYKTELTRHAGIVEKADSHRLLVKTAIQERSGYHYNHHVDTKSILAEDADKVRLLYRSYHNA